MDKTKSRRNWRQVNYPQKTITAEHLFFSYNKDETILEDIHLSTVVDADEFLFIEKGRITGKGTHEELMTSHVMYREFSTQQLRIKESV